MKFKVGDRVVSTALPPDVSATTHPVGTGGTVTKVDHDPDCDPNWVILVLFDDGVDWWTGEDALAFEAPPCTIAEAMAGIAAILEEG